MRNPAFSNQIPPFECSKCEISEKRRNLILSKTPSLIEKAKIVYDRAYKTMC